MVRLPGEVRGLPAPAPALFEFCGQTCNQPAGVDPALPAVHPAVHPVLSVAGRNQGRADCQEDLCSGIVYELEGM